MLDRDTVVKMGKIFSVHNEISEAALLTAFETLEESEIEEVKGILKDAGINCVEETAEEKKQTEKSEMINNWVSDCDASNLLCLSNEELCVMAQKGSMGARDAIVMKNKRFIYRIAMAKRNKFIKSSFETDDLFQEGIIGILTAIENFDVSKGYKFLTYAGYWIMQKMDRAALDNGFTVRLPVHVYEKLQKVVAVRHQHPELNYKQLISLIAENLNCDESKAKLLFNYSDMYCSVTSLNAPIGEEQEDELMNFVPDEKNKSMDDIVIEQNLHDDINRVLDKLGERESDVIRRRFGMDGLEEQTLEQVGMAYGVTRERIRQIEGKAIRKLRHPSASRQLGVYLAA